MPKPWLRQDRALSGPIWAPPREEHRQTHDSATTDARAGDRTEDETRAVQTCGGSVPAPCMALRPHDRADVDGILDVRVSLLVYPAVAVLLVARRARRPILLSDLTPGNV